MNYLLKEYLRYCWSHLEKINEHPWVAQPKLPLPAHKKGVIVEERLKEITDSSMTFTEKKILGLHAHVKSAETQACRIVLPEAPL